MHLPQQARIPSPSAPTAISAERANFGNPQSPARGHFVSQWLVRESSDRPPAPHNQFNRL